jgi:cytochrome c-type biogenesis protein
MDEISALSYPVAFAAGFVSFVSPCVLAVVPGYLTFISGVSFDQLGSRTRDVMAPTAAFSLRGHHPAAPGRRVLRDPAR